MGLDLRWSTLEEIYGYEFGKWYPGDWVGVRESGLPPKRAAERIQQYLNQDPRNWLIAQVRIGKEWELWRESKEEEYKLRPQGGVIHELEEESLWA